MMVMVLREWIGFVVEVQLFGPVAAVLVVELAVLPVGGEIRWVGCWVSLEVVVAFLALFVPERELW